VATTVRSASANHDIGGLTPAWTNPGNAHAQGGGSATAVAAGVATAPTQIYNGFALTATRANDGDSGIAVPNPALQTNGVLVIESGVFQINLADSGVNNTNRVEVVPVDSADVELAGANTTVTANTTTNTLAYYAVFGLIPAGLDTFAEINDNFGLKCIALRPVGELGSCTWSLDHVRVQIVWLLEVSRAGLLRGAGTLSGLRKTEVARSGAIQAPGAISGGLRVEIRKSGGLGTGAAPPTPSLILLPTWADYKSGDEEEFWFQGPGEAPAEGKAPAEGILSGKRGVERSFRGTLAGVGRLSGSATLEARRTGALVGTGLLTGVRRADLKRTVAIAGAGVLAGVRRADASKVGRLSGTGILAGVRRTDANRAGSVIGTGILSGRRTLDTLRAGRIAGVGALSGSRTAETYRSGQIIGTGVLTGKRAADVSRSGSMEGTGVLSGTRAADLLTSGLLSGEGRLGATYLIDRFASGALIGGPNKLKGWGIVVSYGLSEYTYNADGTAIIPGVTVDLFRADTDELLQTTVSDANGFFSFVLTSEPIFYYLRGHYDDGSPPNEHLVDTTDEELEAVVTQTQGPSQPSDG
jgi:hypothetical protein